MLTFYRSFWPVPVAVSVCCLAIFRQFGTSVFGEIFWIKVITSAIIFFYINKYKANEYFYYQNLGISKTKLWTGSFLIDFGFLAVLIFLINKLR